MTMQHSISATSLPGQQAQAGTQFLRRVLLGNTLFSALIGVFLIVDAALVASMLHVPGRILTVLGVLIVLAALEMVWFATRPQLDLRFVKLILALDCAWVLVSIVLLLTELLPLTTGGKWTIGVVADIVALFALLEFLGLRRMAINHDNP